MPRFGIAGLAAASAIAAWGAAFVLFYFLFRRGLKRYFANAAVNLFKFIVLAVFMAAALFFIKTALNGANVYAALSVLVFSGLAVYLILAYLCKIEELKRMAEGLFK